MMNFSISCHSNVDVMKILFNSIRSNDESFANIPYDMLDHVILKTVLAVKNNTELLKPC